MNDPSLIMVAMSGGVDSSVSALLLKERNQPVAGMFMKNWEEDDRNGGACTAEEDVADAANVADKLGIPLHRRNFAAEYWDRVFEDFLSEYKAGRTPNPDVLCNREIKFKTFIEHAADLGADFIATGHYVRRGERDGMHTLLRGRDPGKDQSYFLYAIGKEALSRAIFPVGELHKHEVRNVALNAGFEVHDKKDSTGICFIGERDFRAFLQSYLAPCPGEIRTTDEAVLGEHQGLMYYTLGQRQGLGIGGVQGYPEEPWYVLHKDLTQDILYVGQGLDHPWLMSTRLMARQLNWVSGTAPQVGSRLSAKVRYRQADQACRVIAISEDDLELSFERPQRAVTPGQSVVLYDGEECLGGGIIEWADAPPAAQPASLRKVAT
jgi:tRNA-specific 2-thiouridylase